MSTCSIETNMISYALERRYLKTGRSNAWCSWTQRLGSSETSSLEGVRSESEGKSSVDRPNGWVWWKWAWFSANPNNAPATYLCVGVRYDVAAIIPKCTPDPRFDHAKFWFWSFYSVDRRVKKGLFLFLTRFALVAFGFLSLCMLPSGIHFSGNFLGFKIL